MSVVPDPDKEYDLGLTKINTIQLTYCSEDELKNIVEEFRRDVERGMKLILYRMCRSGAIVYSTNEVVEVDKNGIRRHRVIPA